MAAVSQYFGSKLLNGSNKFMGVKMGHSFPVTTVGSDA